MDLRRGFLDKTEASRLSESLSAEYRKQQFLVRARLIDNLVKLRQLIREPVNKRHNPRLLNTTLKLLQKPWPKLGAL